MRLQRAVRLGLEDVADQQVLPGVEHQRDVLGRADLDVLDLADDRHPCPVLHDLAVAVDGQVAGSEIGLDDDHLVDVLGADVVDHERHGAGRHGRDIGQDGEFLERDLDRGRRSAARGARRGGRGTAGAGGDERREGK